MLVTEQKLIIGFIRGSHALAGRVKVSSTSGEFEHFFKLTEVTLRKDETEKIFAIEAIDGGASGLYIKFKGIDSAEEAKRYSGWEILVLRSMACPLKEGEFYTEDLKGCSLVYDEGSLDCSKTANGVAKTTEPLARPMVVGTITDVVKGGADDLFEVLVSESLDAGHISTDKDEKARDAKNRKVLVPFRKEFIGTVDIEHRTVQLVHLWILE